MSVRKRVLVAHDWDEFQMHALCQLDLEFLLLGRPGERRIRWRQSVRPFPQNALGYPLDPGAGLPDADCLVVCIRPDCRESGKTPEACLEEALRGVERYCGDFKGSRIVFNLGYPVPRVPNHDSPALLAPLEHLSELVAGAPVVCDYVTTSAFWGIADANVIHPGLDPLEYPPVALEGADVLMFPETPAENAQSGLEQDVLDRCTGDVTVVRTDSSGRILDGTPSHASPALQRIPESAWMCRQRRARMFFRHAIYCSPHECPVPAHALCEAMMSGMAVVANDTGATREIMADRSNGILATDVEGFASALAELKRTPPLRAAIGREARNTALKIFHINNFLNAWDKVLQ
jgi:hypothetical protein